MPKETSSDQKKTKQEEFEERVQARYEKYETCLDSLSGARKMLISNILKDYCRIDVQLDDVNEAIIDTGTTIEDGVHGKVTRNPDIVTQHQFITEKNALLAKLIKYLPESDQEDAIAAFMR